jgi:hypothetical protein
MNEYYTMKDVSDFKTIAPEYRLSTKVDLRDQKIKPTEAEP